MGAEAIWGLWMWAMGFVAGASAAIIVVRRRTRQSQATDRVGVSVTQGGQSDDVRTLL